MGRRRAELLKDFQYFSSEYQVRRTTLACCDLDILPTDSAAPTCLQRFQRRFFCREPRGIMLRSYDAAAIAVSALGFSENAFGKARRPQQYFANTRNFDNVYTDGNNHWRRSIKSSWILLARV